MKPLLDLIMEDKRLLHIPASRLQKVYVDLMRKHAMLNALDRRRMILSTLEQMFIKEKQ